MKKVLVANRGEIAVRVFRTARALGLGTVAVYSEADENALHTLFADEAVAIGGSEPRDSYLNIDRILDAARATGADAIHPGYGFLSERAEFSAGCREAGITFIGPKPEAMIALGDKISAKKLAETHGVPLTPGFFEPGATDDQIVAAAERIGYPVMLKASAGGGGRGMRVVRSSNQIREDLATARNEAQNGFGSEEMMVEKFVEAPLHIEVQIAADHHGNVAALFERECSVQRRHQKMIEEAPWHAMTESLWTQLREASITLAKAAGYTGLGTVEFMVPIDNPTEFYFLEVNARLQVEHPVTEAITGLDLVKLQFAIADGEALPDLVSAELMAGNRAAIQGHAIEARIQAEDPQHDFRPSIGKIFTWLEPSGPGIRVDTGYGPGKEVSRFYDSMLAKVIAHGEDRISATQRLQNALRDFHILGPKTNIGFLLNLIQGRDYADGKIFTTYLQNHAESYAVIPTVPEALLELVVRASGAPSESAGESFAGPWDVADGFRNVRVSTRTR